MAREVERERDRWEYLALKQVNEHVGYIIYEPQKRARKNGNWKNKLSALAKTVLIFMGHRFYGSQIPKQMQCKPNFLHLLLVPRKPSVGAPARDIQNNHL
jgi:hypothetical protein